MYLKILEINVLKYKNLILLFLSAPGLSRQACLEKTEVKLELSTNIDIFFIIEEGISGGICMQYIDMQK